MGSSLKIVMNQMLGTVMAAFSEGLVLGEALGLPRKLLLDALLEGAAGAPFLKLKRYFNYSGDDRLPPELPPLATASRRPGG